MQAQGATIIDLKAYRARQRNARGQAPQIEAPAQQTMMFAPVVWMAFVAFVPWSVPVMVHATDGF